VTAAAQVCDPELFGDLDPRNKTNCNDCSSMLRFMAGPLDEIFQYCFNLGEEACSQIFKEVITEEGICYTYNGIAIFRNVGDENDDELVEWTLEGGNKNKTEIRDGFPRFGSIYPLNVKLRVLERFDYSLCKGLFNSFRIYLHLPNEVPPISKHYYMVSHQYLTSIYVSPNMISTEPELRELSAEKRQCFFSDERYLRFFKYYTQGNCKFECVANLTLKNCGCLRLNMPSKLVREKFNIHISCCDAFNHFFRYTWCQNLWNRRDKVLSNDGPAKCRRQSQA
jgi:acid-sensing ion channel, other